MIFYKRAKDGLPIRYRYRDKTGTDTYFFDITYAKTYNLYMPRIARIVAAGHLHHINQRGNYRKKDIC